MVKEEEKKGSLKYKSDKSSPNKLEVLTNKSRAESQKVREVEFSSRKSSSERKSIASENIIKNTLKEVVILKENKI